MEDDSDGYGSDAPTDYSSFTDLELQQKLTETDASIAGISKHADKNVRRALRMMYSAQKDKIERALAEKLNPKTREQPQDVREENRSPDLMDWEEQVDQVLVFNMKSAMKDPRLDPRVAPLGPVFLSVDTVNRVLYDPSREQQRVVTPALEDGIMGLRRIDFTMSRLDRSDKNFAGLIQLIGKYLVAAPKAPERIRPNNDGTRVHLLSAGLYSKPCPDGSSVANVNVGRAQGGKSEEALTDVWVKFFVHGCPSVYYVRCQGGLGDTNTVIADFVDFNRRITRVCAFIKSNIEGFAWITQSDVESLHLHAISSGSTGKSAIGLPLRLVHCSEINPAWNTQGHYCLQFTRPTVIVSLKNKSHLEAIMNKGCTFGAADLPRVTTLNGCSFELSKRQVDTICNKVTFFDLMGGMSDFVHAIRSLKGVIRGEITIHSAYPPCAWYMDREYDNGVNHVRLRLNRCEDEVDAGISDNKRHLAMKLTYDSELVRDRALAVLAPEEHAAAKEASARRRRVEAAIRSEEAELAECDREIQVLQGGEEYTGSTSTNRKSSVDDREMVKRTEMMSGKEAADNLRRSQLKAGRSRPNYAENSSSEVSDDDDAESTVSTDSLSRFARSAKDERIKRRLEEAEEKREKQQSSIEDALRELAEFREAELQAMEKALPGMRGQQAAAMYTFGITATPFACLHDTPGTKTVTRMSKMPTPDAYNDFCVQDPDSGEWMMLINPSKPAQPGSICVIPVSVRKLGAIDLKNAANKNMYFDTWLIENGKCSMTAGVADMAMWPDGKYYVKEPQLPLKPRGQRNSAYTIRAKWIEDPKHPEYCPWIAAMISDYDEARFVAQKRLQTNWERNGEIFTNTTRKVQDERRELLTCRRVAQMLCITSETRTTKMKDHLLANLFFRLDVGIGGEMHETTAYNFNSDGVQLYFLAPGQQRHIQNFYGLINDVLQKPSRYLNDLETYLSGDPSIEQKELSRSNLQSLIDRVEELALMADRAGDNGAAVPCKQGSNDQDPLWRKTVKYACVDEKSGVRGSSATVGHVYLTLINFRKCKQARYIASFFTLLDAVRWCEWSRSEEITWCVEGGEQNEPLPLPFLGMTKRIGGRAQRYMCHLHRSRVQGMCHCTDVFPNKMLGLCMAELTQEGARQQGYDDPANYNTSDWMKHWVTQYMITTEEFVVLMGHSLRAVDEIIAIQENEAALDGSETFMMTLVRVVTDYQFECLKMTRLFHEGALQDHDGSIVTTEARLQELIPETKYPELVRWLSGFVNNASKKENRYIRHSIMHKKDEEVRSILRDKVCEKIKEELSEELDEELGEDAGEGGDEETVEEEQQEEDDDAEQFYQKRDDKAIEWQDRYVPMASYGVHFQPGGTLDARNKAEEARMRERIDEIVRDRDAVHEEFEGAVDKSKPARTKDEKDAAKKKADDRKRQKEQLHAEMVEAGWEPEGKTGFTARQIKEYNQMMNPEPNKRSRTTRSTAAVNNGCELQKSVNRHELQQYFPEYEIVMDKVESEIGGENTANRITMAVTSVVSSRLHDNDEVCDVTLENILFDMDQDEMRNHMLRFHGSRGTVSDNFRSGIVKYRERFSKEEHRQFVSGVAMEAEE